MRTIHVIGIGMGDPGQLTVAAIRALNDTEVFFAMDKGERTAELVAARRRICERYITGTDYRFVTLPDPVRAGPAGADADYRQTVAEWHGARAALWAEAITSELGPDGVGAVLAWGDPSLYDSTLRILDAVADRVAVRYDVIPGITAIQALTAAHRIPLNEVGRPVLITTGRRLRAEGLTGATVVLLDGDGAFADCPPQTRIWWGAYLGGADEVLVAGTVGAVAEQILATRAAARERHGWIMDTYLLRPVPDPPVA
ncbi:precorrin-6A synthase (deacetylating) [Mycolicibacillus parakoreensis]|uniref:Precorrin-6A synthase (Deacetylating) n=1 Tax=Mycolicibacillus parakoreensis TaxID=1069221 RepID=A0ABY3U3G8_9MYCO|nr:precorrin-6A synthase (deacetylating) [Mycolicibacillus parakoreensis]MCV7315238.1 precorrin-6A synthase (deacetylating) [Mycolicibacillus parakoreensis]ULN53428.1 precorrin-6A synthase (deacetylating) [Mycolicibacillus parakoreensis]HLR99007.1 precorrin-6A synthase (deacetylating) [Mycolicibacillus parakoreensis]